MIKVAESAKEKITEIRTASHFSDDYFVRVSVVSGGCSGLSYKMDFDNESRPNDQVFLDNDVKVVTDLKSFLYLFNTVLEFSGGLDGKGFVFNNPNASRTCGCGESFCSIVSLKIVKSKIMNAIEFSCKVDKELSIHIPVEYVGLVDKVR